MSLLQDRTSHGIINRFLPNLSVNASRTIFKPPLCSSTLLSCLLGSIYCPLILLLLQLKPRSSLSDTCGFGKRVIPFLSVTTFYVTVPTISPPLPMFSLGKKPCSFVLPPQTIISRSRILLASFWPVSPHGFLTVQHPNLDMDIISNAEQNTIMVLSYRPPY